MTAAEDAAPEIDGLVWTVNRGVTPKHGPRIRELANSLGLDSLHPLPVTADFLLARAATVDIICRRMPYRPRDEVGARLDELATMGLIERSGDRLGATGRLRKLLEAMRSFEADIAATTWVGHDTEVGVVTELARKVALAASADHVVAAVHRELPAVEDPFLLLFDRLVTLRYVRQHDHVVSWVQHGLTAPSIVAMTALWHGQAVAYDDAGLATLIGDGLATRDPIALTRDGAAMRDDIETQTNRRAQLSFDALDEDEAKTLLSGLRSLPGSGG
jgi:hypothetical protein